MIFEPITGELIPAALEIVNSNPDYNILENGNPLRTVEEVRLEFLNSKTDCFLVILENKTVGIIDFLENNPRDNYPWIGLFMLHGDYHGKGYGKKVYFSLEEKLKQKKFNCVRIGVLQKNVNVLEFWKSLGFRFYGNNEWEGKVVDCFEKYF
jgi:GNAT superfamily N-acetyltransferase